MFQGNNLQRFLLIALLCDISNLHTSIPSELGVEVISYWLHKKQDLIPQWFTDDFIIESLRSVLKNNILFDDRMHL